MRKIILSTLVTLFLVSNVCSQMVLMVDGDIETSGPHLLIGELGRLLDGELLVFFHAQVIHPCKGDAPGGYGANRLPLCGVDIDAPVAQGALLSPGIAEEVEHEPRRPVQRGDNGVAVNRVDGRCPDIGVVADQAAAGGEHPVLGLDAADPVPVEPVGDHMPVGDVLE